jgi:5-methylcytosine-specific restriction endonuclease McrA
MKPQILSLYGNVAIPKGYCPDCATYAFIINNKLQCCDAPVARCSPTKIRRESEPEYIRKQPPKSTQKLLLEEQDYRCFYCNARFGDHRIYNGRERVIKLNWDHMVPWIYSQNNASANFVAACQHCNGLKKAMIFDTLDQARIYLNAELERRVSPVRDSVHKN